MLFEKFCRFRHVLNHGLAGHSDELFRRKILSARRARARCRLRLWRHDPAHCCASWPEEGEAVGIDCAQNFIDLATSETAEASIKNASFFVADAQCDDLRGPYDHGFSRFGTMFFYLPGVALRNIRRALAPGGKLSMIVWRRREDNPWVHEAERRVRQIVPVVAHEETDQVHCGPGPVLDVGPDMVSDMLRSRRIRPHRVRALRHRHLHRPQLDDAVEVALALGPAARSSGWREKRASGSRDKSSLR